MNHHIHTKTVIVHLHSPSKRPPKTNFYLQSYNDNWIHHSHYDDDDKRVAEKEKDSPSITSFGDQQVIRGNYYLQHNRNQNYVFSDRSMPFRPQFAASINGAMHLRNNSVDPKRPAELNDDVSNDVRLPDHYVEHPAVIKSTFPYRIISNPHPRQYYVHENVVEDLPEDSQEFHSHSHVVGQKKRLHHKFSRLHSSELNEFHDDEHEESNEESLVSDGTDEKKKKGPWK